MQWKSISRSGERVNNAFCAAKVLSRPCLSWVISRHSPDLSGSPLYPQERTSESPTVMSALDQKATNRGSSHSSRHGVPPTRQPHRELGEVAHFAVDSDRAAVLLGYDLVADREPKPGALAGRLGREEGLEQFLPVFRQNTDAIVTHPHLDAFAELAGRDLQCRAVICANLAATLVSSIEGVAYEIEEHAS